MKQKLLNSFKLRATLLVAILCSLFTGTAWGDTTVTISISSFSGLPSAAKYDTYNWSQDGLSGKATIYGSTSATSMQFNASNYLFYSTSATSGKIKSIKLTTASGTNRTYEVYGSTSAYTGSGTSYGTQIGSQTVTTSGTTFTVSSGEYTYFTIVKSGSGAGYLSSVEVTYEESSAPAYTITAQSNNNNYGTVSLSGSVITATPEDGYTYADPAYTVSSGTATVSQSGNEFTVTPSSDCTVQINFEAIPTHTATFSVNGNTTTQDFAEGAAITFPSNPVDVNGKTFVGWVTSAIDGTTNNAPSFVTSATMGGSDVTYYAVFVTASGTGDPFWAETPFSSITSSDVFVIATKTSANLYYAIPTDNSTSSAPAATEVSVSNGKISNVPDKLKWNVSGDATDGYTFYPNGTTETWLYCNTVANSSSNNNIRVGTGDRKKWVFDSNGYIKTKDNYVDRYLSLYNSSDFRGYINTSNGAFVPIFYKYTSSITYSDYCTTVPQAVAVTNVSVDATASVNVDETTTLTATVSPNNATNKNVTWESSDESIATVDANGVVTGVAAGSTTITVTSVADNTKTASCTVTVTTVAVTSVSVDGTASVNVGGTTTLTATVSPSNATNKNVTWSSSDDAVATVDANGVVTGVAAGEATITVTSDADNTKTATCTVTVSLVPGTAARPYTVAEALTAINALEDNGTIDNKYVAGKVSQVDSYSNGAITYWISEDGTTTSQLQVYRGKGLNGDSFSAVTDLEVGDAVVVSGQLKKYVSSNNTTPEFNSNSQLVSRTEKPASDLAKTSDIVLDYLNNNITADVTEYINSSSTGAYTYESADPTVATVSAGGVVTGLKVGSTTITVNQAATLSYKAGTVEIPVTVSDTRTAASTIPGINISTLAEGAADGTIEVVNPVKADEGATFSFESSDENVLLIIGNAYTVGEVGTTTVTVTATPSNTNLYKPVVANFNVTVQAAVMSENEITLAASSGNTVYGTPLDVNYTVATGYDGTMSYTIANSAIADVAIGASAITFTPKAVGSTTVTISAPATGNFYAADDVTYTLTVTAPAGKTTAFEAGTAVLDFTQNGWGLPVSSSNGLTAENSYTYNGITIKLAASTKYYLSSATAGYLMLGKSGSTLTLPAFDKAVTQIDVEGTSGASTSVVQNIYVGETAVSTATTGAKDVTNEYIIDPDYQAAGNIYTLKVTNAYNTQITSITIHFKGITATLNANGYATFCSEYPLDFSDYATADYSAWQVSGIDGTKVMFDQVTGDVKGGTGLLLMGTAEETVTLTSSNSTTVLSGNQLFGTTAPTYVESGRYYGLSGDTFKKINAGTVKAGKAILPVSPEAGDVKSFTFVFNGVDGVQTVKTVSAEEVNAIFNLAGQRLQKMQRGINIVNGKKVLMK